MVVTMLNFSIHFRKYFLLYTLIPLLFVFTAASYYRFMVLHDYVVMYEGNCDPERNSCFVGCIDQECTEKYYYSMVTKNAAKLIEQCGEDITNCEFAYVCLPVSDEMCSITYCNIIFDGDICETLERKSNSGDNESVQSFNNSIDAETVTELNI